MLALHMTQAVTYQEDFLQERKDREKIHAQMEELKDQSVVTINRLEAEIQNLKTCATASGEDFQCQSQIMAYKKQLDACKKELEEERRSQVMKDKVDILNEQMFKLKYNKKDF